MPTRFILHGAEGCPGVPGISAERRKTAKQKAVSETASNVLQEDLFDIDCSREPPPVRAEMLN